MRTVLLWQGEDWCWSVKSRRIFPSMERLNLENAALLRRQPSCWHFDWFCPQQVLLFLQWQVPLPLGEWPWTTTVLIQQQAASWDCGACDSEQESSWNWNAAVRLESLVSRCDLRQYQFAWDVVSPCQCSSSSGRNKFGCEKHSTFFVRS